MMLLAITAAKKAGTTTGGTNHDDEVPWLSSVVLSGKSGEGLWAPPSSSQRAIAAVSWVVVVWGLSLDLIMCFTWDCTLPITRVVTNTCARRVADYPSGLYRVPGAPAGVLIPGRALFRHCDDLAAARALKDHYLLGPPNFGDRRTRAAGAAHTPACYEAAEVVGECPPGRFP